MEILYILKDVNDSTHTTTFNPPVHEKYVSAVSLHLIHDSNYMIVYRNKYSPLVNLYTALYFRLLFVYWGVYGTTTIQVNCAKKVKKTN